jgi:hypothetical protein
MKQTLALGVVLAAALVLMFVAWWIAGTPAFDSIDVLTARTARAESDQARDVARELPELAVPRADDPEAAADRVAVTDPIDSRASARPRRVGTDLVGAVFQTNGVRRKVAGVVLHFNGPSGVETALANDGEYFAPGLQPGRWHVTARLAGYVPLSADVQVVEQDTPQHVDFSLERLPHLKIKMIAPNGEELTQALRNERSKLTPAGPDSSGEGMVTPRPKLDVLAVATSSPPGDRLAATLEDGYESYGRGIYRPYAPVDADEAEIGEKYTGILELAQPLPAYVSATLADVVLQTQFAPWNAEEVVFHLSTAELEGRMGSLRLRIVDADSGRPITHGRVGLHANGHYGTGLEIIDPNGYVVFDAQPPGPRHLSIVASGHEWVVEQVRIEAGHVTDLGTYRLNRPIAITGEVVDENDRPVRAWVSLWPLERYDATQRINEHFCWHTDEYGRFAISPAGRHKYVVRLNDEEWSGDPFVIDASEGSVQGLKLRAKPSSSVTVSFDPETPRGARLCVTDSKGLPVAERAVEPKRKASVRLAPGRYRLTVSLGEDSFGDRSVAIGSAPVDVSFAR